MTDPIDEAQPDTPAAATTSSPAAAPNGGAVAPADAGARAAEPPAPAVAPAAAFTPGGAAPGPVEPGVTGEAAGPHTWRPDRFMVIAAHPDDADFGPAATAAAWIDAGSVGWLVCCTSGDAGGEDPFFDPLELAAIREREQRAAAEVVGYAGVTFLHMPDGALVNDLILREHLVREIRSFKPDAVLATDPENAFPRGAGVNHTDHRAAGWAAADAVYPAARNPMAFPAMARGGLGSHRVRRLYFFWTHRPNAYVDITATVSRKLDALRCHESQIKDFGEVESWINEWSSIQGKEVGVANADGFFHVVIDEDEDEKPEPEEAAERGTHPE